MKTDKFERWLQTIDKTEDEELSCSECFDLVSGFVELELSGADPVAGMPKLKQHLEQCSACREEYETLRDLSRLEKEGKLPSAGELKKLIP
jgi:hypothetical protein